MYEYIKRMNNMSKIQKKDRFYYNHNFLGSSSGRSLRILSEYYGPLQRLEQNNISETIVFLDPQEYYQKKKHKKRYLTYLII